ncbi:coiled-coil domain-containing protein 120 [Acipenser ruthenus]|uniref:coiled-coil domain-containing protein 120 n=1 Tax=Acipenser ruthenus TaxID=7906 RepID=UPI0027428003|nr:coiled-coil domain-containing protein 120 [Acipenser ruthenus]XP_058873134.1 coiled-coil domain-containing protein 120 [Acipenser ruthenus]XP_058873135.1 coiled-coil domain-containing protein 120 [Acipenser ruthenus]XP_058873136.1 coiled-coil domain-containing protein 120 [Acipenser ruthenus]XP_058873137.1 coiled-coil domain-containing protein 120 [Acipenser ruthenus]XP_058873138.1 coiled-coil domain-containing protein 120 [Acipenser ruthenus]XP_058873139.1 coiled-coil domain-containing pr
MEVKGHLITSSGLGSLDPQSSDLGSKLRSDHIAELLDRKRALQSALSSRLVDLKKLCLQEAELTGELPNEYPLQSGERPPHVRRRVGGSYRVPSTLNAKGEESWLEDMERQFSLQQQIVEAARRLAGGAEPGAEQRRRRRQVLSSATRRLQELEELINEQRAKLGRKPTQRAARLLQDDCFHSENSSVSDSTSHENDEPPSSSKPLPERPSPPRSRLGGGSPDCRATRQLSPVEVYYEIRTRRSSVASTASPSCTLPRSISNVEGRSVPATPLLPRTTHSGGHLRHDIPSGLCLRQWSDTPEGPLPLPLQEEMAAVPAGSFERGGCPNSARTRRSNSTEALLDHSVFQEPGGRGGGAGLAVRGPFKSSETLRQPERYESGVRGSVSGRCGTSYNEILLDYVWEKQQQMQQIQAGRTWVGFQPASPAPPLPSHRDFAPSPTNHGRFYGGFPNNSPLLRGRGELRRVKVTRTKSCGPFIPLQEQQQNHQLRHPPLQHQHQEGIRDFEAPSDGRDELPWSRGRGDESSHILHKALALEGLRDWYIRNALAHSGTGQPPQGRGQDFGRRRLHQQPPRQSQPDQSCHSPNQQLSQSVSFHGNPLHSRHLELSLYQDHFHSQLQDLSLADPAIDIPSPGTLV